MKWWEQLSKANDAVDVTAALGIVLVVWLVLVLALRYGGNALAHLARRKAERWSDLVTAMSTATSSLLLLPVALYVGASALDMPVRLERLIQHVAVVALLLQVGLWANGFVGRWMEQKVKASRGREPEGATALSLLSFAARLVLWTLVLLLALDQLNFDITALVAGLGIGGIAVALAVQNVLGDLFASLSIVLDKPFVVGDFIVVDNLRGTVERVGIKTTHLRSLDGELLIFSNTDLLKSRIRNFKRMLDRRIEFTVGVTYRTPPEKLRQVPKWLKAIVEAQPRARFDRAHFKQYGDWSLVFEIVYYVLSPDYNTYMDVQQSINLAIYERFEREGVGFAFPTRTVHLEQEPAAEPA
jgi:small-conductance mechanosensitive channel